MKFKQWVVCESDKRSKEENEETPEKRKQGLLQAIIQDPYATIRFAEKLLHKNIPIPDIIMQTIIKNKDESRMTYDIPKLIETFLETHTPVPEELLKIVAEWPTHAANVAKEYMRLIPGPDFPTGGEIIGTQGIQDAYREGKGSIPLRGVVQIEEIQPGRGRHRRPALIVTELPFQVNKAGWIEKVADLANNNKVQGIADIRDESDREGMRVVIELKREANPAQLLAELYQKTPLQMNFGATLLGIVNGEPRQLSLKGLLQEFLRFREETLTRRYRYELDKAQSRLEIVGGLLTALTQLDQVIEILRNAPDGSTAKVQLQVRLDLSDRQGDAILAMPLRRLLGTERTSLEQEAQELRQQIQSLERLLGDRHELLKSLKKDLRALKRKYDNPRRTRIYAEGTEPALPVELESGEEVDIS